MSIASRMLVHYLRSEYIFSRIHNLQEHRKHCIPDRIIHGSKLVCFSKNCLCFFLFCSIISNYQHCSILSCLTCRSSDITLTLRDPAKSEYLGEIHLSATLWPRSQEDKDQVSDVTLMPGWSLECSVDHTNFTFTCFIVYFMLFGSVLITICWDFVSAVNNLKVTRNIKGFRKYWIELMAH